MVQLDSDLILRAIALTRRSRFSFWDSLIVEAAIEGEATILYTEDLQHGQTIDGVRIENPFIA